jgi:hypothetical protein
MKKHHNLIALALAAAMLAGCDVAAPTAAASGTEASRTIIDPLQPCREPYGCTYGNAARYDYFIQSTLHRRSHTTSGPKYDIFEFNAVSRAYENVAYSTVQATLEKEDVCNTGGFYQIGSGSDDAVGSYRDAQVDLWSDDRPAAELHGYRVSSTHAFTPASGATGGGTYYRQYQTCG